MKAQFGDLFGNAALWAALGAWFVAQLIKTVRALALTHKLNLSYIVSSGGMPSSHSALVVGLATAIGRIDGVQSTAFALAAVLAGVVMYDAAGVRLAVSKQARILNFMLDDFFHERGINEKRLHELIGHTPVQVFAGALIGVIFGIVFTL
ncbi:MAG: putative membrane protein YuiD [Ktedonobacterales bacterium]|jgi:acid phosphatase family membrane protein YuiD|nr:MAG: putative membrane protein YuiD [Ktedonobacterales bacterium]